MAGLLQEYLAAFLEGRETYRELTGGLRLQFRAADNERPFSRLMCYRVEIRPSDRELATVRRILEPMLPKAVDLKLQEQMSWYGRDGKERIGRAFTWYVHPGTQGELFGGG